MIHFLPRAIHQCSAEGKSDITAEIKHHLFVLIKMFTSLFDRVSVCLPATVIAICSNVTVMA